jgi:predicted Zn-dependent peptidase
MRIVGRLLSAVIVCCLCGSTLISAQTLVNLRQSKLKNGLRVILVEDHSAPVIALDITYNVGSRDEHKGRTGFAHLFEHMMFKGSANVGRGEHFMQVFTSGGSMNGMTNPDRTFYYEVLPANQLEMALFLESDRMRSLAITKENLDNQRNAVQEERRQFVDNQPYGKTEELQQGMIYDDFAYKHVTIGSMEDLNAASVADVAAFFKTYYAPNNAVLVLVGDFDAKLAPALIEKYFGNIPSQPAPPLVVINEPAQTAERRATLEDPLARLPQIDIAFKAAPGNTADFYALQILSTTLLGGQSSRLYQKLVKEKELVTKVGGFMDERRGPGALYIKTTLRPGKKPEDVEAAIYEEIERVMREPVADWELQKAKNTQRLEFFNQTRSAAYRAIAIGINAVHYDDPNYINTWQSKIDAVTKDDVQRVAKNYLGQNNRTVIITMPKASGPAGE